MKFEIDKTYTTNLGAKVALLYRTGNNLAFIGAMGVYYTDLEGQCADPGKSVQPPLKFEIGKHYTTKLGHKVRLDAIVQGRLVFKAAEHAYRTTMDGKAVWGHMDVVEEWREPQAPLKLEVGKYYKTRSGSKVRVVEIRERSLSHTPVTLEVYGDKVVFPRAYPLNGQWLLRNEEHPFDIVEEWKEPSLNLEVGKTYNTRNGGKVKLTQFTTGNIYCFEGESWWPDGSRAGNCTYTKLGEAIAGAKDMGWNLVSEDLPPTLKPVLKFSPEKIYLTNEGSRVKLKSYRTANKGFRCETRLIFTRLADFQDIETDENGVCGVSWNCIAKEAPEVITPPLKLEVGKYYKTRDGYRAQVVRSGTPHISHNVVVITFEQATPVTRTYTPQGQWAINLHESSLDLVAEWTWPKSEKLKPLEEGDIVVATAKSGHKVVRVFAGYSDEEPTVYKDGYFEGQTAGNWKSVELLMKGKDA